MKIIYTQMINNYNDDMAYEFDGETITAKYKHNAQLKPRLEKQLTRLKNELAEKKTKLANETDADKKQTLQVAVSKLKTNISKLETKISNLDMTVEEEIIDLSALEEGDKVEQGTSESTLPVNSLILAYKKDGELYVKLAHMPLPVDERKEKFGDKSYRVNVMKYEVV